MRNVARSYQLDDAPEILKANATKAAATVIAKSGSSNGIQRKIYSDPYDAGPEEGMQSRVIDKLNDWYFGKCAYCERYYKLDVEHYRPKGEVRGLDNELLSANGYYWLGYEWSNLLPSCISCNRDGGKNSKFPFVAGGVLVTSPTFDAAGNLNRTYCLVNHQAFMDERPMLLNPECDNNIQNYFRFEIDSDLQGIKIVGTDAAERGLNTIVICKLNRQEIRRDRLQNVVKNFTNSINSTIAKLSITNNFEIFKNDLNLHIQKLYNDLTDVRLNHTLLRRFIVQSPENFDEIVIPFIDPKFQSILSTCFRAYIPL